MLVLLGDAAMEDLIDLKFEPDLALEDLGKESFLELAVVGQTV